MNGGRTTINELRRPPFAKLRANGLIQRVPKAEITKTQSQRIKEILEEYLKGTPAHDIVVDQVESYERAMFEYVVISSVIDARIAELNPVQQEYLRNYLIQNWSSRTGALDTNLDLDCHPNAHLINKARKTKSIGKGLLWEAIKAMPGLFLMPELKLAEVIDAVATKLTVMFLRQGAKQAVSYVTQSVTELNFCDAVDRNSLLTQVEMQRWHWSFFLRVNISSMTSAHQYFR